MAGLKEKTTESLQKELAEKRAALQAFRFGASHSRSRNVREGRAARREIARILTELNRRMKENA